MKHALWLASLLMLVLCNATWSGQFPDGPVTAIVPFGPGGGTDRSVRVMTVAWEKLTGHQMRVVNMPGAGSATGMRFVLKSRPDGYTIVQNGNQMSTLPYFFSKQEIGWELKDFQPIACQQLISMLLVVPANSPFKTLKDLVEYGRANPGKIRHGSVGYGGDSHVAFKTVELGANFVATVVPYDSGADVAANIAGGHIDAAVSSAGSIMPLVRGGQARILAVVSSKERLAALPDTPTAWEQGVQVIAPNWRGWLAPPNVPADRIAYIAATFKKALTEDKELISRIEQEAEIPQFMGPEEFAKYLAEVDTFLGPAIKAIQEEEKQQQ